MSDNIKVTIEFKYKNRLLLFIEMSAKSSCTHIKQVEQNIKAKTANGCEEYLKMGFSCIHLRLCLSCGHVGRGDSSINKHGTKHFKSTGHPIIKSFEPGEDWKRCYIDNIVV
jgi:uncharacterized UBP type Zn finger protein